MILGATQVPSWISLKALAPFLSSLYSIQFKEPNVFLCNKLISEFKVYVIIFHTKKQKKNIYFKKHINILYQITRKIQFKGNRNYCPSTST